MARDVVYRPNEFREQRFDNHATTTLGGNLVLTISSPRIQFLDPGGADRTVTLPAVAICDGMSFIIANNADALELLTVNNAGASTQVTIGPGQSFEIVSDGATWTAKGRIARTANIETLGTTHVLTATSPEIQTLDPGGSGRNVTLPAAGSATVGLQFLITNAADGAEALTVKDSSSTIVAIAQNERGIVYCDGATWHGFIGLTT